MASAAQTALGIAQLQQGVIESAFRGGRETLAQVSNSNARIADIAQGMFQAAVTDRKQRADEFFSFEQIRIQDDRNQLDAQRTAANLAIQSKQVELQREGQALKNQTLKIQLDSINQAKKYQPYVRNLNARVAREEMSIKNNQATVDKNIQILQKEYDGLTTAQKYLRGKDIQNELKIQIDKRNALNQETTKIDLYRAEIDNVTLGGKPGEFLPSGTGGIDPSLFPSENSGKGRVPAPFGFDEDQSTFDSGFLDVPQDEIDAAQESVLGEDRLEGQMPPSQLYPNDQEQRYIPKDIAIGLIFDEKTSVVDAQEILANTTAETRKFIQTDLRAGQEMDFLVFLGNAKRYNPANKTEDAAGYVTRAIGNYERTGVMNVSAFAKFNSLQAEAESAMRQFRLEGMEQEQSDGTEEDDKLTSFVQKKYNKWLVDRTKSEEGSTEAQKEQAIKKGTGVAADGGLVALGFTDEANQPINLDESLTQMEKSRDARVKLQLSAKRNKIMEEDVNSFMKQFVIMEGPNAGSLNQAFKSFMYNNRYSLPGVSGMDLGTNPEDQNQFFDQEIRRYSETLPTAMQAWKRLRDIRAKQNK